MKTIMRLRGLTQKDLVNCGFEKATIWKYLNKTDRVGYDLKYVRKLAEALGCTVGWLLQDNDWLRK